MDLYSCHCALIMCFLIVLYPVAQEPILHVTSVCCQKPTKIESRAGGRRVRQVPKVVGSKPALFVSRPETSYFQTWTLLVIQEFLFFSFEIKACIRFSIWRCSHELPSYFSNQNLSETSLLSLPSKLPHRNQASLELRYTAVDYQIRGCNCNLTASGSVLFIYATLSILSCQSRINKGAEKECFMPVEKQYPLLCFQLEDAQAAQLFALGGLS